MDVVVEDVLQRENSVTREFVLTARSNLQCLKI
jgi:hypothetical protein